MAEHFLKLYVAYKAETNFVDVIPQAKALVLKQNSLSGLVINPFGQAMFLTRNHIADVDNTMRGASGKRELRLRATSDYPIGLPPALEALLRGHEEVYRVWLVAAKDALAAGYAGVTCNKVTGAGVMWQTIIHTIFILSALGIAWTDKVMSATPGKRAAH